MSKENILRKTYGRFSATGKVKFNKKDGFEINIQSKNNSNYIYSRATLHVDAGDERLSFAQLMGGYDVNNPYAIRAIGKDKDGKSDFSKRLEIDWDDRLDADIIKNIADNSLITVALEKYVDEKTKEEKTLYKKFLSAYDAIEYIKEHLVEDTVVYVTGDLVLNEYDGKTSVQKQIQGIYLSNADEDKFNATFRTHILIDRDSLGEKDEDGLIPLGYYGVDYNRKGQQNVVIPHTIYIDPSRYPRWDLTSKRFKPTKRNEVWVLGVEGKFSFHTDSVDVTIDDLSDDLREMVLEGLLTEDEAFGRAVGSNRAKEVMLFNTFLTKKNKDGVDMFDKDDTLYTTDDFVFSSQFEEVSAPSKKASKNPFEGIEESSSVSDDIFDDFLEGLD